MNSLTNDYEVDVRQIHPTLVVLVASKVGGCYPPALGEPLHLHLHNKSNLIVLVASKVGGRYPLALGGPLHLSGLRDQHPKWREKTFFSTLEFRQSRFDQVYSDLIVAPEVFGHYTALALIRTP